MSNVPVPASKSVSANALNWGDSLPSFVPAHLKPAKWCGHQWQKITTLDGKNACSKTCQVILRIIPAIFLVLASVFASVIGLIGSCCSSKPVEYSMLNMEEAVAAEMPRLKSALLASINEDKVAAIIDALEVPDAILKAANEAGAVHQIGEITVSDLKNMMKDMVMPQVSKTLRKMRKELAAQPKADVMSAEKPKGEEKGPFFFQRIDRRICSSFSSES